MGYIRITQLRSNVPHYPLPHYGTCYKAANWICLGKTKGRGKLEKQHKTPLPKKTIWIYPLTRNSCQGD
ncbi:MAG: DUF4338 domain-containing protein [Thermodesulfobacteriota bacterium]|nr:DUF4338 domain-containing protein [Thermodesulfobacteriota bacterium]